MYLPEGYKPSRLAVVISAVFLSILLAYAVHVNLRNYRALSGETRFTIATTTRIYFSTSGRVLEYEYQYAGKIYKRSITYAYKAKVPDGRYYFKVSVNDPEVGQIFLDKPVPDYITEVPSEGWRVRPW